MVLTIMSTCKVRTLAGEARYPCYNPGTELDRNLADPAAKASGLVNPSTRKSYNGLYYR